MPDIHDIVYPSKAPPAPAGCAWYETTLLLRPDATEAERQAELTKYGEFLAEHQAQQLDIVAHEPQQTAYSIGGHSHAAYVYMNYAAPPAVVDAMHKLFATPTVGSEPVLMRFMTMRKK
jgi:ribosomal protein S6